MHLLVVGAGTIGIESVFKHSAGRECRRDVIDMFVRATRRTLYWMSVMRWSGVKGKVMGPGIRKGESGVMYGISGALGGRGGRMAAGMRAASEVYVV